MGLAEQSSINKGFSRKTVNITTAANGEASGSVSSLGGGYVLLNASTTSSPCRIRLYSTSQSVSTDRSRQQNDFSVDDSVGLISDIVLTSNNTLEFNPPILGLTLKDGATWYNISSSVAAQTTVTLQSYPFTADGDSTSDKQQINIFTSAITTSSLGMSGSMTLPKSFVILTGSIRQNIFIDPTFKDGTSFIGAPYTTSFNDGNGWDYLIATKSAVDLNSSDGVTDQYPGVSNAVAAKFGTRTGDYQVGFVKQTISVSAGQQYRVSGYVYGNNTTSDAVGGPRYPVGILIYYPQTVTYDTSIVTGTNPTGWQFLSKDITIPTGTSSIAVVPYIDGPYPFGYPGGTTPICTSEQNSRGCPGYAWFSELSVARLDTQTNFGARVKLYSTQMSEVPQAEQTRSFISAPDDTSKLIGDFMFETASQAYNLVPTVEGYTWTGNKYVEGTGRMGYQILNISSGSSYSTSNFVISLLTHKLEN